MKTALNSAGARLACGLCLLALLIASWGLPSQAAALTVDNTHPRLFFSADSLSALRTRFGAGGPGRNLFNMYKTWVDGHFNDSGTYYCDDLAAVYVISQETRFADRAITLLMTGLASSGYGLTYAEGVGPCNVGNGVIVYDWCYDRLTPAQRTTILNSIYTNRNNSGNYVYAHQPLDKSWAYSLGTAGDFGTSTENNAMMAMLQASVNKLEDFFLPCQDALRPEGAQDGYSGQKLSYMYGFRECLRLSTDYTGSIFTSGFLNHGGPVFWTAALRPDYWPVRMPGKYNPQYNPATRMAFFSSRLGYRVGQDIANRIVSVATNSDMPDIGRDLMYWYNPTLPSSSLSTAPLDYFDPQMRFYYGRSGWNMGATSTDVLVSFFNSPDTEYREGRAQNHFTISRGVDNLLIDSGKYGRDDDDSFPAYYIQGIAHNTVLVYDTAETFGNILNSYGHTHAWPNDGGQNRFDATCDGAGNPWTPCVEWGEAPPIIACRGSVEAIDYNTARTVITSDATPSYNAAKVSKVVRKFYYIKPDMVLIQDKVVLRKPNLPVRVVFHSVERPAVNGTLTALEGVLTQGGVFQSTNSNRITIDRGNSSARIYVLQAEGGASEVRLVGGPNRNGQSWKQNIESSDTYSYVSSLADQSFEFYVDGKNYCPGGRDETSLRDHRNDAGPDPAGDWRIEHLIQNATTEVRTAYLIHITTRNDAYATVSSQVSNGVLQVSINKGGQDYSFGLCPPEQQCAGMGW